MIVPTVWSLWVTGNTLRLLLAVVSQSGNPHDKTFFPLNNSKANLYQTKARKNVMKNQKVWVESPPIYIYGQVVCGRSLTRFLNEFWRLKLTFLRDPIIQDQYYYSLKHKQWTSKSKAATYNCLNSLMIIKIQRVYRYGKVFVFQF